MATAAESATVTSAEASAGMATAPAAVLSEGWMRSESEKRGEKSGQKTRKGMIAVIYAEATAIDCAVIRTAWPVGHFTLLARWRSEGEPTTIRGFYTIRRGCARIGCKAGACRCGVRRRSLLRRSRPKERYQASACPLEFICAISCGSQDRKNKQQRRLAAGQSQERERERGKN